MSYINIRLPVLKERLKDDDRWYMFYLKCDSFLGSQESIEYLSEQLKLHTEMKKNVIAFQVNFIKLTYGLQANRKIN